MTRRGLFKAIIGGTGALFLPKSEKVKSEKSNKARLPNTELRPMNITCCADSASNQDFTITCYGILRNGEKVELKRIDYLAYEII